MKIENKKIPYHFYSTSLCFRHIKVSNFTSGWVQNHARRKTGDSRGCDINTGMLVWRFLYSSVVLQYCAKVMQAKCPNFVLCSRKLSTKVRAKVRAIICWNKGRYFVEFSVPHGKFAIISDISQADILLGTELLSASVPVKFFTRLIRSASHVTYTKYILIIVCNCVP